MNAKFMEKYVCDLSFPQGLVILRLTSVRGPRVLEMTLTGREGKAARPPVELVQLRTILNVTAKVQCSKSLIHYENTHILYIAIFHVCKKGNFQMKNYDILFIFAQNIDRGYMLKLPQQGGSNEYPQSMF